jgi:hypothetical protein
MDQNEQNGNQDMGADTSAFSRVSFIDASVLDMQEMYQAAREDVKLNRIEFIFPDSLGKVDIRKVCRALTRPGDFDVWYDLTMQMLEGKPLTILIKDLDGTKRELCSFQVVDRDMDLNGVGVISENPYLVVWLTEFMEAYWSKKLPLPTRSQPQTQAAKKRSGKKKARVETAVT